ncbi:hypothetical protein QQF64_004044, partial [Cirrhinus molitorella]
MPVCLILWTIVWQNCLVILSSSLTSALAAARFRGARSTVRARDSSSLISFFTRLLLNGLIQ